MMQQSTGLCWLETVKIAVTLKCSFNHSVIPQIHYCWCGGQDLAQTSAVTMVHAKLMGSVNVKVDGQGLTALQVML